MVSTIENWGAFNMLRLSSLIAIYVMSGVATVSAADAVTEDQIVQALTAKKEGTRELLVGPRAAAIAREKNFVEKVRGLERVLSTKEREEISVIAEDKPKIDLEITFDYDSAEINSKSLPSVESLGRALISPSLKGSTFLLAGHTDAAGIESYNQDLSQRRADSIKRFLIEKYGVPNSDIVTVGYGKTKLKDPANPLAEINRRVQVSNLLGANAAK